MGASAVVFVFLVVVLAGAVTSAFGPRQPVGQHAIIGLAAALGAVCASLLIYPTGLGGPQVDGLLLVPAVVGAVLIGGLTAAVAGGRLFDWEGRR